MAYRQFDAPPQLKPYIETYWSFEGVWSIRDTIRLFPDGCIDLILNLGEDICSVQNDFIVRHESTYLIGLATSFKEHYLYGKTRLFGIRFKPGAFGCFYQYESLHRLSNSVHDFERSLFPDIDKLIRYKIPYVNRFLLDRLQMPRNCLQSVVADIRAQNGMIKIHDLTRRHFITERQLERLFQSDIGVSPKAFMKMVRFNYTMDCIRNRAHDATLMEIAFDCGYYDHAHLANDMKAYTGLSPSALILSDFSKTAG